jgi:hypothetical protein
MWRVRQALAARQRAMDVLHQNLHRVRQADQPERDGGAVRVRLLIDVMMDRSKIPELGEMIAGQPAVRVVAEGDKNGTLAGRLVGAQPVEANATLAEPERKP